MNLPESILVAAACGAFVLVLAVACQVPRWARVYPLLVAGAVGGTWALGVLHPTWALDSLLFDAPWAAASRVLAVQIAVVLLAPWMMPRAPLRLLWLGAAAPVVLATPGMRALVARHIPGPRARAAAVLTTSAVTAALPALGPGVGATGWYRPDLGALGVLVVALLAVGMARGEKVAEPGGAPVAPRQALAPVLLTVPFAAVVLWIAALGGCLEFQAVGLESAPVYVPRITWGAVAGISALLGAIGDEATASLLVQETLARALSLRGPDVGNVLALGLATGSGLPAMVACGAAVRWALPFWILQVVWVVAWCF